MPYEPAPLPAGDTLTVQVEGAPGTPERLYVLTRRGGGVVHVREDSFGSAVGSREYAARADELLAAFERAARDRRRLSVELPALRHWLAPRG